MQIEQSCSNTGADRAVERMRTVVITKGCSSRSFFMRASALVASVKG